MRGKSSSRKTTPLAVFLLLLSHVAWDSATPAGAAEGEDNAGKVLDGLQRRYEATPDFEADFIQETKIKTLNRKLKAAGRVYFKKPGRML